jgi:hypothetical protein
VAEVRRRLAPLLLAVALAASACGDGGGDAAAPEESGPQEVTVGKEFTHDDFTVTEGWELGLTDATIAGEQEKQPVVRAEVVNNADEARFALLEFVFASGDQTLATVRCSSDKLDAGATGALFCPGFGQVMPSDYDTILVQPITR